MLDEDYGRDSFNGLVQSWPYSELVAPDNHGLNVTACAEVRPAIRCMGK